MRAGPRREIFFDPAEVTAAVVTCGGLCPGINNVVRQIVVTCEDYGVKRVLGIRYGFRGFFQGEGGASRRTYISFYYPAC